MEPKFWIFIGESSGMPIEVQKCTFMPTIHPGNGRWVAFSESAEHEAKADGIKEGMERAAKICDGFTETMKRLCGTDPGGSYLSEDCAATIRYRLRSEKDSQCRLCGATATNGKKCECS
jgi:hypothetical protein